MSQFTLAQTIEAIAGSADDLESIIIGPYGWDWDDEEDSGPIPIPKELKNIPISWEIARTYLDYKWDTGYGSPSCHAFYAYTKDKIIFVSTYDGSTGIEWIPRYPCDTKPEMFGGG